jgi:pantetheine-phosphate adenylyltransferase
MKTAIFPGTFNPPSLGHFDIISRSANLFDQLYVGIGQNSDKPNQFFSIAERIALLKQTTKEIPNVEVVSFNGLLVDYVKEKGISVIIRSMRNLSDFEFETVLASMNRQVSGVETLIMIPDEKYRWMSSTLIRELAEGGKRLNQFIPDVIEPFVFERLSKR